MTAWVVVNGMRRRCSDRPRESDEMSGVRERPGWGRFDSRAALSATWRDGVRSAAQAFKTLAAQYIAEFQSPSVALVTAQSAAVCEQMDPGEAVDGVWTVDDPPVLGEAAVSENAAQLVGVPAPSRGYGVVERRCGAWHVG